MIYMAGIDHDHASVDVRSVFTFSDRQKEKLFGKLKNTKNVRGSVILSTCNRTELWLSLENSEDRSFIEMICECAGADIGVYGGSFIERTDAEAVEHLFYLTAGMRSQIFGEDQILTQAGDALADARRMKAADSILEVLFRQAVTSAKRIKTETVFSFADESVMHAALKELRDDGVEIKGRRCLVIGNGMMGRLAAEVLRDAGADVTVTVRQHHHKEVVIPEGCGRVEYARRYEVIPECSLVVSATSSPHYTVDSASLKAVLPGHSIYLIDLAVPRDIEPQTGQLQNVCLYDIDSFRIINQTESFDSNMDIAEKIIREEQQNFYDWLQGKNCIDRIGRIRTEAGQDTVKRLLPVMRHMQLSESEKEELKMEIASACERMMNHLLFGLQKELPKEIYSDMLIAIENNLNE